MSLRASSRSAPASGSSPRPHLTAAALRRCTATVLMTSTAGTSAISRTYSPAVSAASDMRHPFDRPSVLLPGAVGDRADGSSSIGALALLSLCGPRERSRTEKWRDLPPASTASPGYRVTGTPPAQLDRAGRLGAEEGAPTCVPGERSALLGRSTRRVWT